MLTVKMRRRLDILLADDGSPHALAAIHLVNDLPISRAALPKSSITLLEVVEPGAAYDAELRKADLEQATALLEPKGLALHPEIVSGTPAETIIAHSKQLKPDLIVVGARGRRAFEPRLGSVAQRVVEAADYPVLVVRSPYQGLKRAMLVTDGSACSQVAAQYVARFPLPAQIDLHVLTVLTPFAEVKSGSWHSDVQGADGSRPEMPLTAPENLWLFSEPEALTYLEQAAEALRPEYPTVAVTLIRGDPGEEILGYVKAQGIDLVVACARGRNKDSACLLGSVAQRLVAEAACSVMVVKGRPRLLAMR
jgi:nucleotide-binding universal stress UspA family protein